MIAPELIHQLINGGETLDVEFKGEERRLLSDDEIVETVVCLANRSDSTPAWLLIGVEDDGRVTGARPRHEAGHTDPLRLAALIANRTRPALIPRVTIAQWQAQEIIVIEVPPARSPVATAAGKYLRRAIGGDGPMLCAYVLSRNAFPAS